MILGQTQQFASPEAALAHYGVKGMRWGVRKDRKGEGRDGAAAEKPSPAKLTPQQQKKVDKFLKTADVLDTRISELKAENEKIGDTRNPAKRYVKNTNNNAIKSYESAKKTALKNAEAVKQGKLTTNQKYAIAGGLAVAALLAANAASQGNQSGALASWQTQGGALIRGQESLFKKNPALSGKMSADELLNTVAKPVNPGYSKSGGKMNCRRSTYAYELRRRGYDVHATTSSMGWGQGEQGVMNALTPGSKNFYKPLSVSRSVQEQGVRGTAEAARKIGDKRAGVGEKTLVGDLVKQKNAFGDPVKSDSAKVLAELAKQPEGARGEVLFKFAGFGHSMAYEVVGGKPYIFDAQKGKRYDADTRVETKWDAFHSAEIRRLDNLDLDYKFLTRWARNNP